MINPNKSCIWTSKRTTELVYKNSEFIGTGISLRVLLHAFVDTNLIWYSKKHGVFDDNVTIVAIGEDTLLLDESLNQNDEMLSIKEVIDKVFHFQEYYLTDKIASQLGIKTDGQTYISEKLLEIKYQINIHDDCFSSIVPVDTQLLTKIINCVLRQHEFYLKVNVNWSNVVSHITHRLTEFGTIQIQSDPKHSQLHVKLGSDKTTFIQRIFQSSLTDVIGINNGYAFIC